MIVEIDFEKCRDCSFIVTEYSTTDSKPVGTYCMMCNVKEDKVFISQFFRQYEKKIPEICPLKKLMV